LFFFLERNIIPKTPAIIIITGIRKGAITLNTLKILSPKVGGDISPAIIELPKDTDSEA